MSEFEKFVARALVAAEVRKQVRLMAIRTKARTR